MAINVMNWVWDHSRSRNGARLVLLAIADCASSDGCNAWPSIAELTRKSGLVERAVHNAVAGLLKLGELEVDYNAGPRGCNRYRVIMRGGADIAGVQNLHPPAENAPPETSTQVTGQKGADSAPVQNLRGVQISTVRGAESAPGTVLEPSENSSTKSSPAKRRRATRIPDDFTVTPAMAQWARENVPEVIRTGRGKRETDKFINHYTSKSGKDATRLDWAATWRNWMLKAEDDFPAGRPPLNGRQQSPVSPREEWKLNRA